MVQDQRRAVELGFLLWKGQVRQAVVMVALEALRVPLAETLRL